MDWEGPERIHDCVAIGLIFREWGFQMIRVKLGEPPQVLRFSKYSDISTRSERLQISKLSNFSGKFRFQKSISAYLFSISFKSLQNQ